MFTYAKPEEVGVSAKQIKKYVSILEKYGMATHNVIMARHDKIFFEQYWEPFNEEFSHRMYSVTKSFVSIAIGFLIQDGKLSLDDKVISFFPDDIPEDLLPNVADQTVRDMLMMSTGFVGPQGNWFAEKPKDRVKFYFEKSSQKLNPGRVGSKIPGAFFEYDSNGSFILGALAERLSGKMLVDYLREKLFDKIGVSNKAKCLKCPGGHSWGDSALICTPMDLLKVARFVMNYGKVNGEQILSEDYLREATSRKIDNSLAGLRGLSSFGYGYQFWRTWYNSFFFNGMGCQFAICVPDKDIILVYNGANQGNLIAKSVIIDRFFEEIVEAVKDSSLEPDAAANEN